MGDDETRSVHPFVRRALERLTLEHGSVKLSAAHLAALQSEAKVLADAQRERVALDLVATAFKMQRLGGEGAADVVNLLRALVVEVLGHEQAAHSLLETHDAASRREHVTGAQAVVLPSGGPVPEGAVAAGPLARFLAQQDSEEP